MAKDWDKENMRTLGVNLKKGEAEAFKKLADENGTTVGAVLRLYIRQLLAQPTESSDSVPGIPHIVNFKNTDRLKHEAAFHNPSNLTPDQLLNEILDRYFAFVDTVRK